MAEVKILIKGFTNADSKEEEKTQTSTCLVKDGDVVMITDPGVVDDQQVILDVLKDEGLTVADITYVFITHSHLDHYRNIGMFPKAKTLEYWGIWDGCKVNDWSENFTQDIRVIKTPGHNYDGLTLLVKTKDGIVAICGDVFWKENYPEIDEYASDNELLQKSRKLVIEMADYIVPGHGDIYKVNK